MIRTIVDKEFLKLEEELWSTMFQEQANTLEVEEEKDVGEL